MTASPSLSSSLRRAAGADQTGAAAVIAVADLRRTFSAGRRRNRRTIEAVRGVTFTVEPGERLAFIGPNGAGKSTSIKMLTGLLRPSAGTVRVLGLEPWSERRALSRRIGTLFGQRSLLWGELPARTSLATLGAIHGIDRSGLGRRIDELGELLEATHLFDQAVRTLSLGQRMRCELAAALLHRPQLLFLDEPTIGLDLLAKQRFREVLVRLNTEHGTTVFLTSHDVADVEHVAARAVIVNHGTVIHDSPVAALRRNLLTAKRIEVGLARALTVPEARAALGPDIGPVTPLGSAPGRGEEAPVDGIAIDVDTRRQAIGEVLDRVLQRLAVADVSVADPPLETVIGEIYARPAATPAAGPGPHAGGAP
ncbi:MAG: ATP-binding cassette domain-containing protein [Acidimicrobiales bacterium]